MVNGHPIYYRGYRKYLSGAIQIEALTGRSYLQGVIVTELVILLSRLSDPDTYRIISNEIGVKFAGKSWRAADITIFRSAALKDIPLENKYLEIPPEMAMEIDTKAHLEKIKNLLGYFQEKTDQLPGFGVKKVIWIFTDTQKVMIAVEDQDWKIVDWQNDIPVLEGVEVNIRQIVEAAGK